MDQRCNTLIARLIHWRWGLCPGVGGSRASLPAQIIAILQGHLAPKVKDIYSEVGAGEEPWELGP